MSNALTRALNTLLGPKPLTVEEVATEDRHKRVFAIRADPSTPIEEVGKASGIPRFLDEWNKPYDHREGYMLCATEYSTEPIGESVCEFKMTVGYTYVTHEARALARQEMVKMRAASVAQSHTPPPPDAQATA